MSYNSKYKGSEVEELLESIGNKVDKVDGKGLSTEDFTTALKTKLDSLSNYDDATISEAVEKLRTDFDTLVSGDTTTAIKTFNEIVAFLDGIEDSQSLDSIIASIEQQIAAKGTVKSITAGDGLEGGTITDSGTIALPVIGAITKSGKGNTGGSSSSDMLVSSSSGTVVTGITTDEYGRVTSVTTGSVINTYPTGLRNTYAGGTAVTLNGSSKGSSTASFYAPTSVGASGAILKSNGSGAPSWMYIKTINGQSILGEGDITISGSNGEGGDYLPLTGGTIDGDLEIIGTLQADAVASTQGVFANDMTGSRIKLTNTLEFWTKLDSESPKFSIKYTGTGTKFLSDDGTYKEISGGTSSGSAAYPLVEHGTSDTTFTLTPNTFHVWDEVASLDLSFGSETSGVANEFLFQFTSGATATTLTLPDDIKWANDTAPTIAENMIYQVSILRGLASVLEFSNSAQLIENWLTYEEGNMMNGGTITFQYPVASDVTINLNYHSTGSITIPVGETTASVEWHEPQAPLIVGITPISDDAYVYMF